MFNIEYGLLPTDNSLLSYLILLVKIDMLLVEWIFHLTINTNQLRSYYPVMLVLTESDPVSQLSR